MNSKPLSYQHEHVDPIFSDGRKVLFSSHVDPNIALIASDERRNPSHASYIHVNDIPSAVVALFASTSFTQIEAPDETTAKLQKIAGQFIDVFREAMVPSFREEFLDAIEKAESDWDAKCRVSSIINRYENLR